MMFSAIVIFAGVGFADAQVYTPLVNIPGLPPDTAVNLSMYLVGLYDFLLSVVGIVAVMMLIIGGMRYITAAGNQAAVSDAKDIITNALAGLLLAILSWVIVAEINPDVLYIKKPGGAFVNTDSKDLGSCGTWDSLAPPATSCNCIDPFAPLIGNGENVTDQATCDSVCKSLNYCLLPTPKICIEIGSADIGEYNYDGFCHCIDEADVPPIGPPLGPLPDTCNDVCRNGALIMPPYAPDYHCLVADARVGSTQHGNIALINELEKKYCVNITSEQNPFVTGHNIFLMVNAEKTVSGNPVAQWRWDFDGDGAFEHNLPAAFTISRMLFKSDYDFYLSLPNCIKSNTPDAITCYITLQVEDNAVPPNISEDKVFIRILNYH